MNKLRSLLRSALLWVLLAPYLLTGIGAASNQLVLIANHDKFPVMVNQKKLNQLMGSEDDPFSIIEQVRHTPNAPDADGMIDDVHCVMTDDTHLNLLADVFDMHSAIYSIGDFLLMAGDWGSQFCPYIFVAFVFKKVWDADAV